jgi:hypothetical protein
LPLDDGAGVFLTVTWRVGVNAGANAQDAAADEINIKHEIECFIVRFSFAATIFNQKRKMSS